MSTPDQVVLFRGTCFGSWLDLMCPDNDPGYVHYILQRRCQCPKLTKPIEEPDELWFKLTSSYAIRFGRREFCLVTGFRFGPKTAMIDYIPQDLRKKTPAFRDRVFPKSGKCISIDEVSTKLKLKETFVGERKLSDEDCVRLYIIMLVKWGFIGKRLKQVVDDGFLQLLEDFGAVNEYPWGSHIWEQTYFQLSMRWTDRAVRFI